MTAPTIVDYYGQCVDGLIEYLLTIPVFFKKEWQVTRNDSKLQQGADYFTFFRPGNFSVVGSVNSLEKDYDWVAIADIYSRYKEYVDAWSRFEAFRAALIFYINVNPALAVQYSKAGGHLPVPGLMGVHVEATGEALPFESTQNLGAFIVQPLRFTMRQHIRFPLYAKRS